MAKTREPFTVAAFGKRKGKLNSERSCVLRLGDINCRYLANWKQGILCDWFTGVYSPISSWSWVGWGVVIDQVLIILDWLLQRWWVRVLSCMIWPLSSLYIQSLMTIVFSVNYSLKLVVFLTCLFSFNSPFSIFFLLNPHTSESPPVPQKRWNKTGA
jgi:hypothetical protein